MSSTLRAPPHVTRGQQTLRLNGFRKTNSTMNRNWKWNSKICRINLLVWAHSACPLKLWFEALHRGLNILLFYSIITSAYLVLLTTIYLVDSKAVNGVGIGRHLPMACWVITGMWIVYSIMQGLHQCCVLLLVTTHCIILYNYNRFCPCLLCAVSLHLVAKDLAEIFFDWSWIRCNARFCINNNIVNWP